MNTIVLAFVGIVLLIGPTLLVSGLWARRRSRLEDLEINPPLATAKLDDGRPFRAPRGRATAGTNQILLGIVLSVFSACILAGAYQVLNEFDR